MAQYSKHYKDYLPQEKTNFEVVMLADNYGEVNPGTGGTAVDAFGRSRQSMPQTLFDSQHRYAENSYWDTSLTGSASKSYNIYESCVNLTVSGALNDKVVRQTKRVFSYQPGKSLLTMNSFAFAPQATGVRQRIGYFGADNGIYFENDGTGNYMVLRKKLTSGAATEIRVAQDDWNMDPFDGTGPSLRTLDISKANIFWMDIEWLGVGDVRCGFVVDGKMAIAHVFHNDNINPSTYMTTAILPLRMEIENTAATTGVTHTAKQICNTVISEGGYQKITKSKLVRRTTNATISDTAFSPIAAIRLNSGSLDSIILPQRYNVYAPSQANFEVAWILNPTTLTNATTLTWTQQNNIDYCIDATTMTGGTILHSEYFSATNQSGGSLNVEQQYNFDTQLGRTIAGTSDVLVLAAQHLGSNTKDLRGSIEYYDLT